MSSKAILITGAGTGDQDCFRRHIVLLLAHFPTIVLHLGLCMMGEQKAYGPLGFFIKVAQEPNGPCQDRHTFERRRSKVCRSWQGPLGSWATFMKKPNGP